MRSMPDYLIFYLSRFLNFQSLGLYFVIERNYLRQSNSYSQGDDDPYDPEDDEDDDDSFLLAFLCGFSQIFQERYYRYFAFAAAAIAAAAFSRQIARYFSAANSISLRFIFSCFAQAFANRQRYSSSRSAFYFSFCLLSSFFCGGCVMIDVDGSGLIFSFLLLSFFSNGSMMLGMYIFFLDNTSDEEGGGTMGVLIVFSNCCVTFSKLRFCLICSGVIVCSSFHFCTLFLVLSLPVSANRMYSWTSSFFLRLGWAGLGSCTAKRLDSKSFCSSRRGGASPLLKSWSKSSFSLMIFQTVDYKYRGISLILKSSDTQTQTYKGIVKIKE